jgi:hypothetical protein
MSKTIYVVFKTARQVDGEYVFIAAERAFSASDQAEHFWRDCTQRLWRETVEGVPCDCERAIHPVELEG